MLARKYPHLYQHGIIVAGMVTFIMLFGAALFHTHNRPHVANASTPWGATTHAWFAFIESPCTEHAEAAKTILEGYPRKIQPLARYTMRNIEVAKNCAVASVAPLSSEIGVVENNALAKVLNNYHANLVSYSLAVRMNDIQRQSSMKHHIWRDLTHMETFPAHMFHTVLQSQLENILFHITAKSGKGLFVFETPSGKSGTLQFTPEYLLVTFEGETALVTYSHIQSNNPALQPFEAPFQKFLLPGRTLVSLENGKTLPLPISPSQIQKFSG